VVESSASPPAGGPQHPAWRDKIIYQYRRHAASGSCASIVTGLWIELAIAAELIFAGMHLYRRMVKSIFPQLEPIFRLSPLFFAVTFRKQN
jgi:hypothetical protein